jgi:ComF family protein
MVTEGGLPSLRARLARFLSGTVDALLPPCCLICREEIDRQGSLCAECWKSLRFISPPLCVCCGAPFELAAEAAGAGLCFACDRRRPAFARARAALVYDDAARGIVLAVKYGDRLHAVPAAAGWMVRAGAELLAETDVLVPVPLHPWRLLGRRFNQAALLAREISRQAGRACLPAALDRRRATPPQQGLSRKGRKRNVAGAFAVNPRHVPGLDGARVLLVDDVLTTGATVEECCRALLGAGAAQVEVLTLARVVLPATLSPGKPGTEDEDEPEED